jgi:VanZ family protein
MTALCCGFNRSLLHLAGCRVSPSKSKQSYRIPYLAQKLTLFRATTLLLIVCLFTIGSIPAVGKDFPGSMHWLIHLAVYALIAINLGLGWQNMRATHVAAVVITIGVIHEMTEIITHGHAFEFKDAIVNGFGALIGVTILTMFQKFGQKEDPTGIL